MEVLGEYNLSSQEVQATNLPSEEIKKETLPLPGRKKYNTKVEVYF